MTRMAPSEAGPWIPRRGRGQVVQQQRQVLLLLLQLLLLLLVRRWRGLLGAVVWGLLLLQWQQWSVAVRVELHWEHWMEPSSSW